MAGKGGKIAVRLRDGSFAKARPEDMAVLRREGARLASPEELKQIDAELNYGGAGGTAVAALGGAAEGAIPGFGALATGRGPMALFEQPDAQAVLRAVGVTPEQVRTVYSQSQRGHEAATGLGMGAGAILGGALIPSGGAAKAAGAGTKAAATLGADEGAALAARELMEGGSVFRGTAPELEALAAKVPGEIPVTAGQVLNDSSSGRAIVKAAQQTAGSAVDDPVAKFLADSLAPDMGWSTTPEGRAAAGFKPGAQVSRDARALTKNPLNTTPEEIFIPDQGRIERAAGGDMALIEQEQAKLADDVEKGLVSPADAAARNAVLKAKAGRVDEATRRFLLNMHGQEPGPLAVPNGSLPYTGGPSPWGAPVAEPAAAEGMTAAGRGGGATAPGGRAAAAVDDLPSEALTSPGGALGRPAAGGYAVEGTLPGIRPADVPRISALEPGVPRITARPGPFGGMQDVFSPSEFAQPNLPRITADPNVPAIGAWPEDTRVMQLPASQELTRPGLSDITRVMPGEPPPPPQQFMAPWGEPTMPGIGPPRMPGGMLEVAGATPTDLAVHTSEALAVKGGDAGVAALQEVLVAKQAGIPLPPDVEREIAMRITDSAQRNLARNAAREAILGAAYNVDATMKEEALSDKPELSASKLWGAAALGGGLGFLFELGLHGGAASFANKAHVGYGEMVNKELGASARALEGRPMGKSLVDVMDHAGRAMEQQEAEFGLRSIGGNKPITRQIGERVEGGVIEGWRRVKNELEGMFGKAHTLNISDLPDKVAMAFAENSKAYDALLPALDKQSEKYGIGITKGELLERVQTIGREHAAKNVGLPSANFAHNLEDHAVGMMNMKPELNLLTGQRFIPESQLAEKMSFRDLKTWINGAPAEGFKHEGALNDLLKQTKTSFEQLLDEKATQLAHAASGEPGARNLASEYAALQQRHQTLVFMDMMAKNAQAGAVSNMFLGLTSQISGGVGALAGSIMGGPAGYAIGTTIGLSGGKLIKMYGAGIGAHISGKAKAFFKMQAAELRLGEEMRRQAAHAVNAAPSGRTVQKLSTTMSKQIDLAVPMLVSGAGAAKGEQMRKLFGTDFPLRGGAMAMLTTRAIEYLYRTSAKQGPSLRAMFSNFEVPPSPPEVEASRRRKEGALYPSLVYQHIAENSLTPEFVEGLREVHPEYFEQVRLDVLEIASRKKNIAYQKRVQLGYLFEVQTDPTMHPMVMGAIQQSYAMEQMQNGPAGGGGAAMVAPRQPQTRSQELSGDTP